METQASPRLLAAAASNRTEAQARLSMADVIQIGAAKRPMHRTCPFCASDPPLAAQIAGRFIVGCESDDCAANPQVSGASVDEAWRKWDARA
jgi:hypothetical protein